MRQLAMAVAFLSVFGIVAYAVVLLLTRYFRDKDREQNNSQRSDRS